MLHHIGDQMTRLVNEDVAFEIHAAADKVMAAVDKERA